MLIFRHNTFLQEATMMNRDPDFHAIMHDVKILLWKLSRDLSLSEGCGGGGKESNVQLIPHLIFTALYVVNTSVAQLLLYIRIKKYSIKYILLSI